MTHSCPTRRSSDLRLQPGRLSTRVGPVHQFSVDGTTSRAMILSAICLCRSRRRTGSPRSEEHTSELQSLMRISYAVFCLKKKKILALHFAPLTTTIHIYTIQRAYTINAHHY